MSVPLPADAPPLDSWIRNRNTQAAWQIKNYTYNDRTSSWGIYTVDTNGGPHFMKYNHLDMFDVVKADGQLEPPKKGPQAQLKLPTGVPAKPRMSLVADELDINPGILAVLAALAKQDETVEARADALRKGFKEPYWIGMFNWLSNPKVLSSPWTSMSLQQRNALTSAVDRIQKFIHPVSGGANYREIYNDALTSVNLRLSIDGLPIETQQTARQRRQQELKDYKPGPPKLTPREVAQASRKARFNRST